MKSYLAVDIGASSGRHMLGFLENGKLKLKEIYRFENRLINKNDKLCWDQDYLFNEICTGMKKCGTMGIIPESVAIDTWGVDYVLLDKDGDVIGDAVSYRDSRTEGMDEAVSGIISPEELYARTGIQKAIFNTIYQLMAEMRKSPERLEKAETLLFMPEYFDYMLTGNKTCEYTVASTSQLLDAKKCDWDYELLNKLSLPENIFQKIEMPGTYIGNLKQDIRERIGYDCRVVHAPAHDTASAVLAVPVPEDGDSIYISSGTWSLMGIERDIPNLTEDSRRHNFTNEGGYNRKYRYLKNIMGLWMIQSVRNELPEKISFEKLCELARQENSYPGRIDAGDGRFLAPSSMTEEIRAAIREKNMPEPENIGQLASCIYHSLADKYAETAKEIEELTGKTYNYINIVGGGCNADYLNELTAMATRKKILTGPSEATAAGNLLAQMIADGVFKNVMEARRSIE